MKYYIFRDFSDNVTLAICLPFKKNPRSFQIIVISHLTIKSDDVTFLSKLRDFHNTIHAIMLRLA